jgi:hypothetical protein
MKVHTDIPRTSKQRVWWWYECCCYINRDNAIRYSSTSYAERLGEWSVVFITLAALTYSNLVSLICEYSAYVPTAYQKAIEVIRLKYQHQVPHDLTHQLVESMG